MTATTAPATPSTPSAFAPDAGPRSVPSLWRAGLGAGVAAAAATVAVAAVVHAAGVSLETEPGKAIPVIGFGQLTLFFTAIGVLLARAIGRRAHRPRTTFTRTTVVLTALSLVPDAILSAGAATKLTLVLTHLVAAAIVIPALSSRLPD
ncbi:MAG: hypothetical protein QOG43_1250 [Actinomycetota bacterium]|nr:hypothetical protein [Actinomycetota bacterium]